MNERTKDIVNQIGFDASSFMRMGIWHQIEKFVSLVSEDCIAKMEESVKAGATIDTVVEDSKKAIKQHFDLKK